MNKIAVIFCLASLAAFAQMREFCWVKTQSWRGNGFFYTVPVRPGGEKWQLRFHVAEHNSVRVVMHLTDGTTRQLVNQSGLSRGTKRMPDKEGYLEISGAGTNWSVEVEQYMDSLLEWRYRQAPAKDPELSAYGIWTGDGGEDEEEVEMPEGGWQIRCQALTGAKVKVRVIGEDGGTYFRAVLDDKIEKMEGMVYAPGKYRLAIESDGPWKIEVLEPVAP